MSEVLSNNNYVLNKPKETSYYPIKSSFLTDFKDTKSFQELHQKQQLESKKLQEINNLNKQNISKETHDTLDKEAIINTSKKLIYEWLDIKDNLWDNSRLKNFLKWVIDESILWNEELAIEIINTKWKIIIDAISNINIFDLLENIASSFKESLLSLVNKDAYNTWKHAAELVLMFSWLAYIWKKWVKMWLKNIAKNQVNKENLVTSEWLKHAINSTNTSVKNIVPDKKINIDDGVKKDLKNLQGDNKILAEKLLEKQNDSKDVLKKYTNKELANLSDDEIILHALKWFEKWVSADQKLAILDAYNIWKQKIATWIYDFTTQELSQKVRILKEAWFSLEERRKLFESWIYWQISKEKILQLEITWETLNQKVDNLISLANSTKKDYDELLNWIWKSTNAQEILDSQKVALKSKENVLSKITSEYNWTDVEKVRDLLRWSLVYDDIWDLKNAVKLFKNNNFIQEVYINNRLDNVLQNDILLNIRFKNWFVWEVQLHVKDTLNLKEKWVLFSKEEIDFSTQFSTKDLEIVNDLKNWKYNSRLLDENVWLPINSELVNTHNIYEIRRGLSWVNGVYEQEIYQKLTNIEKYLNQIVRTKYEQKTGLKFPEKK